MTRSIQLLLIDDHTLFRRGLKALLSQDERFEVAGEAGDVGEALRCLAQQPTTADYHAIILAVGHQQFIELGEAGIKALAQPGAVLYDVKSILPLGAADGRL